ncbi:MAG: hypothetical protein LWW93_09440 [Hyphomicrobiales bacterium]|nr:hypothetical protein [Hyphomicrobiales bacterium]
MSQHLRSRPHDRYIGRTKGGVFAASPMGRRSASAIGVLLAVLTPASTPASAEMRRVVIGRDDIAPLSAAEGRRFMATGMVECGGVRGVGQVTEAGDVVTSAAHVFFDELGRPRASHGACVFIIDDGGARRSVPLVPDARLCGSTSPYGVSGRHDWGMARLAHPIRGLRPYPIALEVRPGDALTVVAFEDGRKVRQRCRVREVATSDSGAREVRTDCTGFDGMSGAAYLTGGSTPRVVGVHVGFRSAHPDSAAPYSERHYTFGAAIGRVFRRALAAAAITE